MKSLPLSYNGNPAYRKHEQLAEGFHQMRLHPPVIGPDGEAEYPVQDVGVECFPSEKKLAELRAQKAKSES